MKAVILAGGLGTRISEETHLRPKPTIEIGRKQHVQNVYSKDTNRKGCYPIIQFDSSAIHFGRGWRNGGVDVRPFVSPGS